MLIVAKIAKTLIFQCGCTCQYTMVGYNPAINGWSVRTCYAHHEKKDLIAANAEEKYMEVARNFLTESIAIAYLREKGYSVIDADSRNSAPILPQQIGNPQTILQ